MGGVRLYPSCPICLITASIIALRSARLAGQHGCLDCLGNEASKKDLCTFEAPAGGRKASSTSTNSHSSGARPPEQTDCPRYRHRRSHGEGASQQGDADLYNL